MISKNEIKLIQSLRSKKFRKIHHLFIVEGEKIVDELFLSKYEVHLLFATKEWIEKNPSRQVTLVTNKELKSISQFTTPNEVVALVKIPTFKSIDFQKSMVILDGINDPGNLGTIIRSADWFGIEQIVSSMDTVDYFSHKVVQASMGSIFRLNLYSEDLSVFLMKNTLETYGAFLEGENLNQIRFKEPSVIVIGSESHGIRPEIETKIKNKITIPRIGKAESLNAGIAASIILNKFSEKQ